jgi:hypothetical protein
MRANRKAFLGEFNRELLSYEDISKSLSANVKEAG